MKRWRTPSILSLLLLFGLVAARPAAAASHVSETHFTLSAGETITLEVSAFGLEFGEPFPERVSLSARKAPIDARRVMKAAAQTGALEDDPLQTQLAIWRAIEGDWSIDEDDADFELAAALFEASSAQNTAPLDAQGLPLNALLRDAVEVAVVDWEALEAEPVDDDEEPYSGRATLEIRNMGSGALDLYVPIGLVLESEDASEQDMGIVAVDGQIQISMTTDEAQDEAQDEEQDEADAEDVAESDGDSTALDEEAMSDAVEPEGAVESEDAEDVGDTGDEAESTEASNEDATMDSPVEDPDELPVTGIPGVPDTLLAMILGAFVLSAGLVLRRA